MSDQSTIADLRAHLFATLAALSDPQKPMEIERARAISDVAQTIINSAKVENDYLKLNNGGESPFLEASARQNLPSGITGIRQHRLK